MSKACRIGYLDSLKSTKRIAILLHEKDTYPELSPHLIWTLCDFWKEMGIEISVLKGISQQVDADLLLPHIDLTELPADYTDFFKNYPRVANRNLDSIAKRHISRQLLAPGDSYAGQVIVKTNLNFAGIPEERIYGTPSLSLQSKPGLRSFLKRKWLGKEKTLDWEHIRRMKAHDYRIFPSLAEVPHAVFTNPSLVVERFMPEYENGLYYIRIYQFTGDRGYCVRLGSPEPVVKQKNIISREEVPIAPEAVEFRRQLGIDFGKVDFVNHGGKIVVLDVNRTPGLIKPAEVMQKRATLLAPGIFSLL